MDVYTATEEAYKNGYAKGYEIGKKDSVKHGHWIIGLDESCMCSECGRVFRYKIGRFCSFCGTMLDLEE